MKKLIILSLLFVGCNHAPPFPQGEMGAIDLKSATTFVYQTPNNIEGSFTYLRDDPLSDWDGSNCVKQEYFNKLHNYARDLKVYTETHCKCQ